MKCQIVLHINEPLWVARQAEAGGVGGEGGEGGGAV